MKVFLDANVLAKPLTRTLLIVGGPPSGFVPVWSKRAADEADRHLGPGKTPVADLASRFGWSPSPTGIVGDRFAGTESADRQLLADAEAAGADFLVTENVGDFHQDDVVSLEMSAVNPDLFLASRITSAAYRETLDVLARGRQRPPATPDEIHSALGRNHPLLAQRFAALFATTVAARVQDEPAIMFRGGRCLGCGDLAARSVDLVRGLHPDCA